MKRIRKFAARVTQPKSEREKARLAKVEHEHVEARPDSVTSEDVPNSRRGASKGRPRRRRRGRSRCASRHSMVLGCDGYPAPPPFCSALNDDRTKSQEATDSSGSQTSFSESDWADVTMPYPFAIGTITGNISPSEVLDIQGGVNLFHPAEPVAGPSGLNTPTKHMSLTNTDRETLSMDSLLEGRATSEEEILGTMCFDRSIQPRYSKYERLISDYWQVRDLQGNTRLENWVSEQIEEVQVRAKQKEASDNAWRERFNEVGHFDRGKKNTD